MESGSITLDGAPIDRVTRTRVAYTPQSNDVDWSFPINAEEVVVLGRQGRRGLFGGPRHSDWEAAGSALNRLGAGSLKRRQIGELSGGERQRVFLARALAQGGDVLLLDEPLSGVDVHTQTVVLDVMNELRGQGCVILIATHDLAKAADLCDRVCLLHTAVVGSGPPHEIMTPRLLLESFGGVDLTQMVERFDGVGVTAQSGR
jgi:manganese/iron transport system ATP-binding protein